jgi:hypothetical protein
LRAFKNNHPEKSAVAQHMLKKDDVDRRYLHNFDHSCLKLLKNISNTNHLDAVESIMIQQDNSGKADEFGQGTVGVRTFHFALNFHD